jgi:polar amino acid transport system substrate-binding protein
MRLFFIIMFVFMMGSSGYCEEPLKVGVVIDPPFVIKNGAAYTGLAIDLWDEIAQGLKRPYTFIEYQYANEDQPFDLLQKGDFDVLVGALSITEDRYQKAEFTLPYFVDKVIAITVVEYMQNTILFIKLFLLSAGGIIATFIILFLLYIHLLWYYERSHTNNFPTSYKGGISHLFWTHVLSGRHSEIPKSSGGKLVILFQKAIFYFIIIMLNATLISFGTATLVKYANPIQCSSDLEQRKVGAVQHSKAFKTAVDMGVKVFPFDSLQAGTKALEAHHIDVFLEDLSTAEAYLKETAKHDLCPSHFALEWDLYSFATRVESPLLRQINTQMLLLRKHEIPQKICKEYLPRAVKSCQL